MIDTGLEICKLSCVVHHDAQMKAKAKEGEVGRIILRTILEHSPTFYIARISGENVVC